MDRLAILAALTAVIGGAYLLLQGQQATDGSGGGTITTDNTTEGSIMDFSGIASQVDAAVTQAPQDNPQGMSGQGLQALMQREGFSATPYPDYKGYSIGYGHLIKTGESLPSVTQDQAAQLLASDVSWAVAAVQNYITAPLSQNQFDALVSFTYNVGAGAFARSTLARRINAGDPGASQEFDRWIYAGGQVNQSLVNRRQSERNQYESGMA